MNEEKKTVTVAVTFEAGDGEEAKGIGADELAALISEQLGSLQERGITIKTCEQLSENEHPNGDRDGICPICGKPIEYENREIDDDSCVCDWECGHCGSRGKLAERIVFDQHFDIYDRSNHQILTGRDEGIDGRTKRCLEQERLTQESVPAPAESEITRARNYAELTNLERCLFLCIVRQTLNEGKNTEADPDAPVRLYNKYMAAVKACGTWLMSQEAAWAIADRIGKEDVNVDTVLALDDDVFLKEIEKQARRSIDNASGA